MSELLDALNPAIVRKRRRTDYASSVDVVPEPTTTWRPLLVQNARNSTYRSELEGAMDMFSVRTPQTPITPVSQPSSNDYGTSPIQTSANATVPYNCWPPSSSHHAPYSGMSELAGALGPPVTYTPQSAPVSAPIVPMDGGGFPSNYPPPTPILTPDTVSITTSTPEYVDVPLTPSFEDIREDEDEEPPPTEPSASMSPVSPVSPEPQTKAVAPSTYKFVSWAPGDKVPQAETQSTIFIPETTAPATEEDAAETDDQAARRHGKDKRVLTIQTAMRRHFLDCMNIGPDDRAPAPYQASDGPIAEDQPLRMEWHKTVIQSKHNQAMRSRVIDSLRSHRKQYPHVPTSAFADDKSLESCYDACFATMRNKWKLQNPSAAPSAANGDGPDTDPIVAGPKVLTKKGIRQRRLARKKARFEERKDARQALVDFAHPTFDKALQIACVSSDESEDSDADIFTASTAPPSVLTSHPPPWRSARIERFFALLDEAAALRPSSSSSRPRAAGKRIRQRGSPKTSTRSSTGLVLPPRGAATWMISKRWRREAEATLVSTRKILPQLMQEDTSDDFDWSNFDLLGDESEDDTATHSNSTLFT